MILMYRENFSAVVVILHDPVVFLNLHLRKGFFLSIIRLTTASIMKTGTIILFRLVIWFRKICFIKRTKFLLAYINIRVKLDRNNENSIGECEILQIDGFFRKVI